MDQVTWAQDLARRLLAKPLPRRWAHSQGVGRKAESIAHIVGDDAELLICAAWLHDIGYAPALVQTHLHSLDGARYLRDVEGANARLCRLVAHHSCATVEARRRSVLPNLVSEFAPIDGAVLDTLTYCDMTTSPDGVSINVEKRLAEILSRYGDGAVVAESINEASVEIIRATRTVEKMIRGD